VYADDVAAELLRRPGDRALVLSHACENVSPVFRWLRRDEVSSRNPVGGALTGHRVS
jgi:hypothetical protein